MKYSFLTNIVNIFLCICCLFCFTACQQTSSSIKNTNPETITATSPPVLEDIDPSSVDFLTETWIAKELSFETQNKYNAAKGEAFDVIMDVIFENRSTGTTLTIPCFFNGGKSFCVRFAPTEYGIWDYKTVCATDESLNGITGTIGANTYKGDLDIYKHGFVKTNGSKYFVYDDGTPFFYLGDTHWNLFAEEFDSKGPFAGDLDTDSHFKYIVDKRVSQGFTVYQSEPLGAKFNMADGLNTNDISGFKDADRYFQYIAEKGLVHANAQFFFSSSMTKDIFEDEAYLEQISRYWVARWGAYPVMWTLAQEIDNDCYFERNPQQSQYSFLNNPWVKVAEFINKYDAYNHPLTGHQENTGATTVTGAGTGNNISGNGISVFLLPDVTERTGHDWWGAQWSPSLKSQADSNVAKDYWNSPKVAVNYEGRYCYLWTKNFGSRAQGWISYLSGMFGYGYGASDIWLYKSTYNMDVDSNDGLETITVEDKARYKWPEAVEFESAYQMGYMKNFFSYLPWWTLVPDFNDKNYFAPKNGGVYTCATAGNEIYVVYLYNQSTATGLLLGMDENASYIIQWFNPRTGEYTPISLEATVNPTWGIHPAYELPQKPDNEDWVLLATKNK